MSTIVAEQEEVVTRIDADVSIAKNYIEAGQVGACGWGAWVWVPVRV